ncbi:MAG: hypothetical protein BWX84_02096 [Verrucomicrobia bacterium ADurb.Bin118]|nr:MAG: hypothetical protein BWX84_02096 [Verrucomicrobia bacterium ADurb.Bin118]
MGKIGFRQRAGRFGMRDPEEMPDAVLCPDKTVVVDVPRLFFANTGIINPHKRAAEHQRPVRLCRERAYPHHEDSGRAQQKVKMHFALSHFIGVMVPARRSAKYRRNARFILQFVSACWTRLIALLVNL